MTDTTPIARRIAPWTDEESELARLHLRSRDTLLLLARCLLRLERLECRLDHPPGVEALADEIQEMAASHGGNDSDGLAVALREFMRSPDPSAASKVAASLPAEPKPDVYTNQASYKRAVSDAEPASLPTNPEDERLIDDLMAKRAAGLKVTPMVKPKPQRFTAPEALPVGAKVRIVELGADSHPQHKHGDVLSVVADDVEDMEVGDVCLDRRKGFYFSAAPVGGGTWVRTVELVEEQQPTQPVETPSPGEQTLPNDSSWQTPIEAELEAVKRERDELRSKLSGAGHAVTDCLDVLRRVEGERDRLAARVGELEAELGEAFGEEYVFGLKADLDAANARLTENQRLRVEFSERMAAAEARAERMAQRAMLAEDHPALYRALAALDATEKPELPR